MLRLPPETNRTIIKTALQLSISMEPLRLTLSHPCSCRIMVLAYPEVDDFAQINTFQLFWSSFLSSMGPWEARTHLQGWGRVKQYPLIPILTRDNIFFATRTIFGDTRDDFRFWLISEYRRLAGGTPTISESNIRFEGFWRFVILYGCWGSVSGWLLIHRMQYEVFLRRNSEPRFREFQIAG